MGTKNNPGEFDCYENAEPDEPMFVLLARDSQAPNLIRQWVKYREYLEGITPKLQEALDCADAMDRWYEENRGG